MYTFHNTLKISDLRKHTADVIEEIEQMDEPVTVLSRSTPRIVIMSFHLYEKNEGKSPKPPAKKGGGKHGLDFFIDPPEEFLIKKKGLDAVKLIRAERD